MSEKRTVYLKTTETLEENDEMVKIDAEISENGKDWESVYVVWTQ